jgi:phage terminase small subunit
MPHDLAGRPDAAGAALAELTAREGRFVLEYLKTGNGTEAARLAGYSERTARVQAGQLLKRPRVQAALQALRQDRTERLQLDADWIVQRLAQIVERCLQSVAVVDRDGRPTGVYTFDSAGALGALRLLGMRLGMWRKVTETRDVTVDDMIRRLANTRRECSLSDS